MSPALNGSSALERFERSNAIELRNGIMFDFYPGLPHVYFNFVIRVVIINQLWWYRGCAAVGWVLGGRTWSFLGQC